jgi:hypothetical protein
MRISRVAFCQLIYGLICVIANAQTSMETTGKYMPSTGQQREQDANENTAETLLQRGLYLSDLYNWVAARPYLIKAKQLFETGGDKRNALYAELGAIRAGAVPA